MHLQTDAVIIHTLPPTTETDFSSVTTSRSLRSRPETNEQKTHDPLGKNHTTETCLSTKSVGEQRSLKTRAPSRGHCALNGKPRLVWDGAAGPADAGAPGSGCARPTQPPRSERRLPAEVSADGPSVCHPGTHGAASGKKSDLEKGRRCVRRDYYLLLL